MTLYDKIDTIDEQALAGKKALADALLQVGITAVEPNPNNPDSYETFQSYADKIKRLMISNSLIMEYEFPSDDFESLTKYQRTLFLPMSGVPINDTAISIIESDTGYTGISTLSIDAPSDYNTVVDPFGHACFDAVEDLEIDNSGTADPQWLEYQEELARTPSTLTLEDMYSFTVDWGDGSPVQEFISLEETPTVWYHEYTAPGTYDVTINGVFAVLRSNHTWSGGLYSGDTQDTRVYDRNGDAVYYQRYYVHENNLKKIIAWGNTRLVNTAQGCIGCSALESVPTYDTTNSFALVTATTGMFQSSSIPALPYDSGALRGLFSNCPNLIAFGSTFRLATRLSEPLPPLLIDGCSAITNCSYAFQGSSRLTGGVPAAMLSGLTMLINAKRMFLGTGLDGTVPEGLLDDCHDLCQANVFLRATNVSGELPADFFARVNSNNNGKRLEANGMFMETNLSGVHASAFSALCVDTMTAWGMFMRDSGMTFAFPSGMFSAVGDGHDLYAAGMFANCNIASVPSDVLEDIGRLKDARCIFGGNTSMTGTVSVPEYATYADIEHLLGAFAGCSALDNYDEIPAELGGGGNRLFPDYHAGMIALEDGTFVEVKDFVYDKANPPIGWCFESTDTEDKVCAWNNHVAAWMTDATKNGWLYNFPDGNPYYDAKGLLYDTVDGKTATETWWAWDRYVDNPGIWPQLDAVREYRFGGREEQTWIPSCSEVSTMVALNTWLKTACDKVVAESGGDWTNSTCYPIGNSANLITSQRVYNQNIMRIWDLSEVYDVGGVTCQSRSSCRFCVALDKQP